MIKDNWNLAGSQPLSACQNCKMSGLQGRDVRNVLARPALPLTCTRRLTAEGHTGGCRLGLVCVPGLSTQPRHGAASAFPLHSGLLLSTLPQPHSPLRTLALFAGGPLFSQRLAH